MRDVSIGYAEAKKTHSLREGEHKKMKTILKKCLSLVLTAGLLASLAACAGQTDTAVVKDLFSDLQRSVTAAPTLR